MGHRDQTSKRTLCHSVKRSRPTHSERWPTVTTIKDVPTAHLIGSILRQVDGLVHAIQSEAWQAAEVHALELSHLMTAELPTQDVGAMRTVIKNALTRHRIPLAAIQLIVGGQP